MPNNFLGTDLGNPPLFFGSCNGYWTYYISKPSGGRRLIQEPIEELKDYQRRIVDALQAVNLGVHVYGLGGIAYDAVSHAQTHLDKKCIVKMDVWHFFPQTKEEHILKGWLTLGYTEEEWNTIREYVLYLGQLPTGAPTSPILSSIAFHPVDQQLVLLADTMGMNYTRYVDDLIFSGNDYPPGLQRKVNEIVKDHGYKLNHKKSMIMYRGNNPQLVTGVTINDGSSISRTIRRELRAVMFQKAKSGMPLDAHIEGQLAHIKHVNPAQYEALLRNYRRLVEKFNG